MPRKLGNRSKAGFADPDNPLGAGNWTVTFTPQDVAWPGAFDIYHMAVKGPASSQFQVYLDTVFYDYAVRGDINSWDPNQFMFVMSGQTIYFYWNVATGNAPTVTIFAQEPGQF